MIRGAAGVPQLMRNVSRGHKNIALFQDKFLVSNDHLQLSGGHVVRFILTRVDVARHAYSGRQTHFQEVICSSRIRARQTDGTDAHVKYQRLDPG